MDELKRFFKLYKCSQYMAAKIMKVSSGNLSQWYTEKRSVPDYMEESFRSHNNELVLEVKVLKLEKEIRRIRGLLNERSTEKG